MKKKILAALLAIGTLTSSFTCEAAFNKTYFGTVYNYGCDFVSDDFSGEIIDPPEYEEGIEVFVIVNDEGSIIYTDYIENYNNYMEENWK